mmetsp:Transcript_33856/g.88877  ORF Transcript_33856/g.88877 Transcript_33856/m.88877 type:complete len:219 (-) Transcript_33856:422-1078(-)
MRHVLGSLRVALEVTVAGDILWLRASREASLVVGHHVVVKVGIHALGHDGADHLGGLPSTVLVAELHVTGALALLREREPLTPRRVGAMVAPQCHREVLAAHRLVHPGAVARLVLRAVLVHPRVRPGARLCAVRKSIDHARPIVRIVVEPRTLMLRREGATLTRIGSSVLLTTVARPAVPTVDRVVRVDALRRGWGWRSPAPSGADRHVAVPRPEGVR